MRAVVFVALGAVLLGMGSLVRVMPLHIRQKLLSLHTAANFCDSEVLAANLASEGHGDVDDRDSFGWTPLMYAAYLKSGTECEETARLLHRAKADLNAGDLEGRTALHHAIQSNSPHMTAILLELGADVSRPDGSGMGAIAVAAFWGRLSVLPLLVERGAKVNQADTQGRTAAMFAALNGHTDVLNWLHSQSNELINVQDMNGHTALSLIFADPDWRPVGSRMAIVKALCTLGAKPNLRDHKGQTALHHASASMDPEAVAIVEVLMAHGADATLKDTAGKTSGDVARLEAVRVKLCGERGTCTAETGIGEEVTTK